MDVSASSKDRILELIQGNPFISQQELGERLGITRSAVASHIAQLIRDHRLLGRAYVLPTTEPILVAGGANLDRAAKCIGPARMATSNPVAIRESFGGVARNVAENLARMGLPVRLMTAVGDDASGAALLKHAREAGIDTGPSLIVGGGATGTYTAMLDPGGEMVIGMSDMAVTETWTLEAINSRRKLWASTRMRVVDLNLPKELIAEFIEDSRRSGASLVIVAVSEPKMNRLPKSLQGVSTLILNAGELAVWTGRKSKSLASMQAACSQVLDQGAGSIVVTLGGEGVLYCGEAGKIQHLKAPRAKIVDATGAGDAFSAGVVAGLFQHPEDLLRACRIGQRLAALTVGSRASVASDLTPAFLAAPHRIKKSHESH
jgi:pseudouridine kinase